jgi:hypothetical protein
MAEMRNVSNTAATDEQLVTRLRQGDNAAMGDLYQRYYMIVFTKCLTFSKNKEDASDAESNAKDKYLQGDI